MVSQTHSRVLATGLMVVEDNLRRIRNLFDEAGWRAMVAYSDDIAPEGRTKTLKAIGEMVQEISAIRKAYKLHTRVRSKSHEAETLVSAIWATLEDLKPEKVGKAYGRLEGESAEQLGHHIQRLLAKTGELSRIIRSNR